MTSLALLLVESGAQYSDRAALHHDNGVLSYAELDDAAARFASFLTSRGVGRGQPVGLMLSNTPEFAICYYSILRVGGVVVPMNPLLKTREVAFYLGDAGASMLIAAPPSAPSCLPHAADGAAVADAEVVSVDAGFAELLGSHEPQCALIPRAEEDVAVLLYTSGTTGRPKGAQLTHANLRHNATLIATTLLELTPDDVVMGCLPLFHVFGQSCGLNAALCSGASLTLIPRFSADAALDAIVRDGVTVFEGVPTMFSALLGRKQRRADAATVRLGVSGGASLPVEVLLGVEKTFGFPVLEGYGLSETSPAVTFNHPDRPRKPGSIGTPVQGVQVRLVNDEGTEVPAGEVGEIAVRGKNVMLGYHNQPDATRAAIPDGWFRTGDLARVDDDGYYFIVDRKKDLIIRGGYNVYPREIEEILYEHPAVADAVVVGIPHTELGEEIGAAIVTKQPTDPADIREFVRSRVAAYKYPRRIWFVDALPTGPTGKILRREVSIPAEEPADQSHRRTG
jgi:long-chain acyl-CoA synthetase